MMHIEQVISLYCGGPGSGRHPEFGTFRQRQNESTYSTPRGTHTKYYSQGGDRVWVHERNDGKTDVYQGTSVIRDRPGKLMHSGDTSSADKFLNSNYGISHKFKE